MYEEFRRELTDLLVSDAFLNHDVVNSVLSKIDQIAPNYKFEKEKHDLVIYEYHLPEEIESYYNQKLLEGQSVKSLYIRRRYLQLMFTYLHKNVNEVRSIDIKSFLIHYKNLRPIKNRALDKLRSYISSFFSWCVNEGIISTNPCSRIEPFKYEVKPRGHLNEMQLEKVRNACISTKERLIVEFFYSTGCRIEEATRIKLNEIDLQNGEVLLFGKGSKYRKSYLDARCIIAIEEYLNIRKHQSEYLFNNEHAPYGKITTSALRKQFEEITKRALGIVITPHIMRHTTATHALKKGMPMVSIQKLLGHKNIATTQIYAECNQDDVKLEHSRVIG